MAEHTEGGPPPENEKTGEGADKVVSLEDARAKAARAEAEAAAGGEPDGGRVPLPPEDVPPRRGPVPAGTGTATPERPREEPNRLAAERDKAVAGRHRAVAGAVIVAAFAVIVTVVALFGMVQHHNAMQREKELQTSLEKSTADFKLVQDWWGHDSRLPVNTIISSLESYKNDRIELESVVEVFGEETSTSNVAEKVAALKKERDDLAAAAKKAQDEAAAAQATQAAASATPAETPKPAEGTVAPAAPTATEATKPTIVAVANPCVQGMITLGFAEADARQGCGL